MTDINVTYTARKDERYDKSYSPIVFVNSKAHYHTERNKKSNAGALRVAKRVAEDVANYYTAQNVTKTAYNVTMKKVS